LEPLGRYLTREAACAMVRAPPYIQESCMFDRRAFIVGAGAALIAASARAQGQAQGKRAPKLAYLSQGPEKDLRSQGFLDALREIKYVEGTDYTVEYFFVDTLAELKAAAKKAVDGEPSLIVAVNTDAVVAAADATSTIPIIGVAMSNPFGAGIVGAMGQHGANVTELTLMAPNLGAKRLAMLQQFTPKAERFGVMFDPRTAAAQSSINEAIVAGQKLNLRVSPFEVRTAEQLEAKIEGAAANGVAGVYFIANTVFTDNIPQIAQATLKHRLPAIFDFAEFAAAGGLIAHGPNLMASYRRSGFHIDRILKGGKPSDVPIEQPKALELVINKKTAAAFGLAIPAELQAQATKLVE
jgi:putative tryptophan/tyrosine transport system substrate-binding protein